MTVLPRHHGDEPVHDVRCVHPAAHADLDDRDVHLPFPEVLESHRGRHLEKGRMMNRSVRRHRPDRGLHAGPQPQDLIIRNRGPIHLDPLVESDEVGRCVQADPIARGLQDGGGIGAHGALAVRPRDMQDLQLAVRIPQEREEPTNVVQSKLDAEPLEAIEMLKGGLVIHRSGRLTDDRD